MFQTDVADREKLPRHESNQPSGKKRRSSENRYCQISSDGKIGKGKFLSKRWSAIKAKGFGVNAVFEEKPDVRDGRQRSSSKWNNSLAGAETVDVFGGSQDFDYDGEMEKQITTKPKYEVEQFKGMMDRCIARWDIGKKMTAGRLRSEALEEIGNSKLEDDATLIDEDFSDDDSFFDSDDEDKFECMDDDVFLLNFCERQNNSNTFASIPKNELTVGKTSSKRKIIVFPDFFSSL